MPKKKTTDVLVVGVLDRSGSMAQCLEGAVEGWNDYLKDLKADKTGKTVVWLTGFDTEIEDWEDGTPVEDVPYLTTGHGTYPDFVPRGYTALYDAIAQSMVSADKYLKSIGRDSKSENPMKVLHVTLTDGYENASVEYNKNQGGAERLQKLTKKYEKAGNWTFVYLGADHDAIQQAASVGYAAGNVATYSSTPDSYNMVSAALSNTTSTLRGASVMSSKSLLSDAGVQDLTDDGLSS